MKSRLYIGCSVAAIGALAFNAAPAYAQAADGASSGVEQVFPGCHRVLKSVRYRGWICVDLDSARKGPRADYQRCGDYIVNKLQPIYL